MPSREKKINLLAPFECHGLELNPTDDTNHVGDCPFCDKEQHFYVNAENGKWDCKSCGLHGNVITFLTEIAEKYWQETPDDKYEELAELRSYIGPELITPGISPDAFKRYRMSHNGYEWLIPIYSEKATVRDIRRWAGSRVMATSGCNLQLGGLYDLAAAAPAMIGDGGAMVWVCEGDWDGIVWRWWLDQAGRETDIVVWVPGANTFKQQWVPFFKGCRVRLPYDNDEPGDNGSEKVGKMLHGTARQIEYLHWPEGRPTGYDLRDFVLECLRDGVSPGDSVKLLESLLHLRHRRAGPLSPEDTPEITGNGHPASFEDVMETFAKWVKIDQDFEDALAVALAVCLANDVSGDPLWFYIVGPPGSGKTLILMALKESERAVFRSTLTPASLVSGFNVHPDPSLLPHLDGKTAVFKDGTELLTLHHDAKRETYSVMRGAFDGHVNKSFGNGVQRNYVLHFNMLIGITPAINGDSQATMGDRFLKIEINDNAAEEKMRQAIENISKEVEMEQDLAQVCRRFLYKKIMSHDVEPMEPWLVDRILALAQILALLRAQVEREAHGDRDMKYRPSYEVGTRIGKQLAKLAQMLAVVYGRTKADIRTYRILERVVFNTCIGFHLDIVRTLMKRPKLGLTREDLCRMAKIPSMTTLRRLQDLEALGIVERYSNPNHHAAGPPPLYWKLTDMIVNLWNRSVKAPPPPKAKKPEPKSR